MFFWFIVGGNSFGEEFPPNPFQKPFNEIQPYGGKLHRAEFDYKIPERVQRSFSIEELP